MITAVPAAILASVLAGCASGGSSISPASPTASTATAQSVATQASAAASPVAVPPPAADTLSCSTVVDPDNNLTARQVIADLEAMLLIDGTRNLPVGTPSQDDVTNLETAELDLQGYSGNQLATDAANFGSDEKSYDPAGSFGGPYASEGEAVGKDILVLAHDYGTLKEAEKLAGL